ncbi:MAG TPA: cation diffusion facilitator family transporter [Polyangiaceae bacterium]|nr:cation diffusion facilitator family transporter [Polyangiaceae bacterium]
MAKKGDSKKVVVAALIGNGGIALAKFVAAALSGSATMLAEGVHSVADTCNQALLLLGMSLSTKNAPLEYPLGRYKESYFWAFIVSLMLFFLGGVFAIYEGVHKLLHADEPPGSPLVPLIVLLVSIGLEAGSFFVAFREFNKSRGKRPIMEALFAGKDPIIPVVLLEDTGAVFGLIFALIAVAVTWITGNPAFDAIGSIVIGVLLCIIGILLARDTRSLLLGERASEELEQTAMEQAKSTPGVEGVTQLLSMHLGPNAVMLALKVHLRAGMALEEVERVIDQIEARIQAAVPDAKKIFIEPDSDYDEKRDPERSVFPRPPASAS